MLYMYQQALVNPGIANHTKEPERAENEIGFSWTRNHFSRYAAFVRNGINNGCFRYLFPCSAGLKEKASKTMSEILEQEPKTKRK
jgi:hypothetical protein